MSFVVAEEVSLKRKARVKIKYEEEEFLIKSRKDEGEENNVSKKKGILQ